MWRFGFETSRFRNFSIFLVVSDSVSKNFGIEKSIGFGIVKIWYRKKYRIRYRKNLVSEKVSDSVSEKFGIGKKFRILFRSDFGYRHTLHLLAFEHKIKSLSHQQCGYFLRDRTWTDFYQDQTFTENLKLSILIHDKCALRAPAKISSFNYDYGCVLNIISF